MSSHDPLLVHIGYHKTGTTWLQTGLFQDNATGFTKPWPSGTIRHELILPDPFDFDPEKARAAFQPGLDDARSRSLVPVLSDERLSGSPHAGGFDSALLASRLVEVFPEARVLIVIREQQAAIYSTYQQYVRDGGGASLTKYLAPRNPAEVPQFRFSHFAYHRLVAHYQETFDRDHVLVLPFEWLRDAPQEFAQAISRFAGLTVQPGTGWNPNYPSLGALTISLKRRANLWLVRNSLNPAAPLYVKNHEQRFERLDRMLPSSLSRPIERRWREVIAARVGGRYLTSNRKTGSLIDIDLAALGYPAS